MTLIYLLALQPFILLHIAQLLPFIQDAGTVAAFICDDSSVPGLALPFTRGVGCDLELLITWGVSLLLTHGLEVRPQGIIVWRVRCSSSPLCTESGATHISHYMGGFIFGV